MKIAESRKINIDADAFMRELEKNNLSIKDIATQAGYSKSWFDNSVRRGFLTRPQVAYLQTQIGLDISTFMKPEEPETNEEKRENNEALYKAIYSAVFDALIAYRDVFERSMFKAVNNAINGVPEQKGGQ